MSDMMTVPPSQLRNGLVRSRARKPVNTGHSAAGAGAVAVLASTPMETAAKPVERRMLSIVGHLDLCSRNLIEGWMVWVHFPSVKVRMQVFVGDRLIGECVADRPREDLREAGHGDGTCAFSYTLAPEFAINDLRDVKLRVLGSSVFLLPDEFTRS